MSKKTIKQILEPIANGERLNFDKDTIVGPKVVTNCDNLPLRSVEALIISIRGVQVILDRDLATLYQEEVGQMNRQVRRNIKRFPADFMFQLTKEEYDGLKCQFGISNLRGGDRRALPYAFTEQGVSMLSGLLRSDKDVTADRFFASLRMTKRDCRSEPAMTERCPIR